MSFIIRFAPLSALFFSMISLASTTAYFEGKVRYSGKEKVEKEVKIFIQSTDNEGLNSYGLILTESNRGALYRIEKLPDGTRIWLNMFQGKNFVLRVNSDFKPEFKGNTFKKNGKTLLRLVPTTYRSNCGEKEIFAKKKDSMEWTSFPGTATEFRQRDSEYGTLTGDLFEGSICFNSSSHSGTFSLGKLRNFDQVATVRPSVVSNNTISGWALKREMIGVALSLYHHGVFFSSPHYELIFMHLPPGKQKCEYDIINMKSGNHKPGKSKRSDSTQTGNHRSEKSSDKSEDGP